MDSLTRMHTHIGGGTYKAEGLKLRLRNWDDVCMESNIA